MMKKINCPRCKHETVWSGNPWRPFCSERCKLLDLHNWIDGSYSVPSVEEESGPGQPDDEHE